MLKNGPQCIQLELDDNLLPEMKKLIGGVVGTCASVGYTVHDHDQ